MSKPILVISCGKSKLDRPASIFDLYTGSFWKTYRKAREDYEGPGWRQVDSGRHPNLDVYVISAKLGIVPEWVQAKPYERKLVDRPTPLSHREYPPETLGQGRTWASVDELADHIGYYMPIRSRDRPPVYVLGNPLYRRAMEEGNIDVISLVKNPRAMGDYTSALKKFLAKHAPPVDLDVLIAQQAPSASPFDLDALIAKVTR